LEPAGALNRVVSAQRSVLNTLLNPARMARLQEQGALDGEKAYAATQFLADLREGIFGEIAGAARGPVRVDAWRRNLQWAYVEIVNEWLNGRAQAGGGTGGAAPASSVPVNSFDDTRGLLRAELRTIAGRAGTRIGTASDAATRAHLEDLRDRIAEVLNPDAPRQGVGASPQGRPSAEECWPDLAKY
jgi:hypothetical protein